eukprot:9616842-Ditylum_brightwellii.AAC.1
MQVHFPNGIHGHGHMLPQFHVVFDGTFSTVPHLRNETIPALQADSFPPGNPELTTWDLLDDIKQAFLHVIHNRVKQFLPLSAVVEDMLPICRGVIKEPSINRKREVKETAPLSRDLLPVPSQEMVEQK